MGREAGSASLEVIDNFLGIRKRTQTRSPVYCGCTPCRDAIASHLQKRSPCASFSTIAPTILSPAPTVLWLSSAVAQPAQSPSYRRPAPLRTERDHDAMRYSRTYQLFCGSTNVIRLAEFSINRALSSFWLGLTSSSCPGSNAAFRASPELSTMQRMPRWSAA